VDVQASGVHVAVDDPVGVQVRDRSSQLPKNTQRVEQRHLGFAKLLPAADVVRRLRPEANRLDGLQNDGLRCKVEQVGVVGLLETRNQLVKEFWLGQCHLRDVYERQ